MKFTFLPVALVFILMSCSGDDSVNNKNPFLIDQAVNLTIDLNLPEFNQLNFAGNAVVTTNQGIKGIVIYAIGNNNFSAFEISDPNHQPNSCSACTINGISATCGCDDGNVYEIVTGQRTEGAGEFPLKAYRIQKSGNLLRITN